MGAGLARKAGGGFTNISDEIRDISLRTGI